MNKMFLVRIIVFCIFLVLMGLLLRVFIKTDMTLTQPQTEQIIQEVSTSETINSAIEYVANDENIENFDPNDPNLPMPPIGIKNDNPNALDVIAPQYEEAQKRLKKLENLREKAINEQYEQINNIQ